MSAWWPTSVLLKRWTNPLLDEKGSVCFIIASELGAPESWIVLVKILDNLASPTEYLWLSPWKQIWTNWTESLMTFYPKKTQHQKLENLLFFNDLAVPELWECWPRITTYLFWWQERRANVVCERDICHERLTEWNGLSESEIRSIDVYNAMVGEVVNGVPLLKPGSTIFRHLFEPSKKKPWFHLSWQGTQSPKDGSSEILIKKRCKRTVLE